MNKILSLFLIVFIIFSFASCRKQTPEFSSFVSEKTYSADINISSMASSNFETNAESSFSVSQPKTSATKVSSNTSLKASTSTNSSKCTHPNYWKAQKEIENCRKTMTFIQHNSLTKAPQWCNMCTNKIHKGHCPGYISIA